MDKLSDYQLNILIDLYEHNATQLEISVQKALNELKGYRDMVKQGKMFIFPCDVGDTIYAIDMDMIIPYKVIGFRYGHMITEEKEVSEEYENNKWYIECESTIGSIKMSTPIDKIGIKIFNTKEQAELNMNDK